jgi:membrane associated rhomboid family serine protease
MRSSIIPEGSGVTLYVAARDAARAIGELAAYDNENRPPPPTRARVLLGWPRIDWALAYWAVLLFFFAAERRHGFAIDWLGVGAARAGLMRDGEWWRAITALCLHVDVAHLMGNLVFGTVFSLLLARVTGPGVAWLAMIAAGAAGNVFNALLQSPQHGSIGASTAIFAGLGLLVALRLVWRADRSRFTVRDFVPMAGGVTLLLYLGFSGENTDIAGHVLGFVCGIAAGWVLSRWEHDWQADLALQLKCGGGAAAAIIGAWSIALLF